MGCAPWDIGCKIKEATDNARKEAERAVSGVSNTVNAAASGVAKEVERYGRNVANAVAQPLLNVGYAAQTGNVNNLGNVLITGALNPLTAGLAPSATRLSETTIERAQREGVNAAAIAAENQRLADIKAAEDKRVQDINDMVGQIVETRRRQPGRAATLLTTIGAANSYGPLLTPMR